MTASTEPRMSGRSWIWPKFTRSVGVAGRWGEELRAPAPQRVVEPGDGGTAIKTGPEGHREHVRRAGLSPGQPDQPRAGDDHAVAEMGAGVARRQDRDSDHPYRHQGSLVVL